MAPKLSYGSIAVSHVGLARDHNEDSVLERTDIGLWAVADGMGGHGGGDVASQAVTAALGHMRPPVSARSFLGDFETRVIGVHQHLRSLASERSVEVIGTTLVAILVYNAHFACVWCGDSRAYLFRKGALMRVSRDHSEVQDLLDRGVISDEEAKAWPGRNVVTRALGAPQDPELEIVDGPVAAGDRFLLCSDGLTGHLSDDEIAQRLRLRDPKQARDELLALTLRRGAKDNVSLVIVDCVQGPSGANG